MSCRSCQKHKSAQDLEANGFDSQTGKGKCPCGQSYVGAPIDTCPRHWNMGLKTPEAVIEFLKKSEEPKENVVEEEKTESEELLDDVAEVVADKPKKNAKKKAKKKVAKKK